MTTRNPRKKSASERQGAQKKLWEFSVGGAIGLAIGLTEKKPTPTDDVDDGEEEGMGITM